MTRSDARRFLSLLSDVFGVDGVLIVPKTEPGGEGADLVPGSALRWPKCECGGPKCPDYEPPAPPGDELSARLAEQNKRSSRGGT
ncbi:hypothetical protein ABZ707_23435 [Streptomyces sp. NPDC006923]|uniref:hypothetical protein n=1 Tax=Streptomyces sp. NPDC006923 TaxID=3155355 RepID=UPI0033D829D0